MRGRKPKPTELKLLEGTFRKDRAPAQLPKATRAGTPHCPEWFDDEHQRAWKKLARHYRQEGRSILPHEVGIHVDYIVIDVQMARAQRELQALEALIAEKGQQLGLPGLETALVIAPAHLAEQRERLIRRIRQLAQERKSLASELGLTPSARSRAGWGTGSGPKPKADDPWGDLAKNG